MTQTRQGKEFKIIGQGIPRVDSVERVNGKAVFSADLTLQGTLHGKILRSPYPHARIKRIDAAKALQLPGVKAVITGADLPPLVQDTANVGGETAVQAGYMRQFLLAEDRALFHGHPVAAVAATTPQIAEDALSLIEVEYEPLPVVDDILEAMKPDSPVIHPELRTKSLAGASKDPTNVALHVVAERGDLAKGFEDADLVIEREYFVDMVHQGYIEPQACTVVVDSDGHMTMYNSTQAAFRQKIQIATLLDMPQSKVKVVPLEIGGGFGGKSPTVPELPTALLALKTGQPVKTVLSRTEVFLATGPAPDSYSYVKIGAKRNGQITALQAKYVLNCGCVPGAGLTINNILVGYSLYKAGAFRFDGYEVVTNKSRTLPYRAPGMPNGAFAIESAMDELAQALGIDPLDLRILNASEDGDIMTDGKKLPSTGLKATLKQVKAHPAWASPLLPGRGRGVAVGMRLEGAGVSSAHITANTDGTFNLVIGSVDLTGTRTTMVQIAAETLGIDVSDISVSVGDTDSVGFTDGSWGSRITYVTGAAVLKAAQETLRQLKERAALRLRVEPSAIEYRDRVFYVADNPEQRISLADLCRANVGQGAGAIIGYGVAGGMQLVSSLAVHVGEVEVDRETGKVYVVKYTAFQNPGLAINPVEVQGQMQGGAAQGVGWALWEGYYWNKGQLVNANFLDYRMPTFLDLPMIDAVFVGEPAKEGPLGVRGVGEISIVPPLPAIGNAISAATGVRMTQAPMTSQRVLSALQQHNGGSSS
ncbi:MAG: xanthine dehydrogenase family protein molybdopterin-binding subunit [Chloroflexi bacterium]|nr:xanthine dehydrogenase family protein molybdopterin-binding subunit [Chloroflexota bacterium]